MARLKMRIKGLGALRAQMRRKPAQALQGMRRGLFQEAEGIMTQSKQAFVPVDTGTLRASGFVELPMVTPNGVQVALGFGGPAGSGNQNGQTNSKAVGYAVPVHENCQAFHAVGSCKYLEIPLKRAQRGMAKRLRADVDAELRKK